MSIVSKDAKRLSKLIESDRMCISGDLSDLILYDLKELLGNYFNLEGQLKIKVEASKDCYDVTIHATASGIKPFGIIK